MIIKAVFFDAAGTLIKPVRRVGESYAVLAQQYGVNVPAANISEAFRAQFSKAPPLAFPDVNLSAIDALERGWWKTLVRGVFEPAGPFERFDDYFDDLFTYFSRPESWALYPEVLATSREFVLVIRFGDWFGDSLKFRC